MYLPKPFLRVLMPLAALCAVAAPAGAQSPTLRPPAVPLVTDDPYLSIWSEADHLTDTATVHWTGRPHSLTSLIRVDGQTYRLMGATPAAVPALPQTGLRVLPTRTIYDFESPAVHVTLTFMTPKLPADLDVYGRPVTYLTWDVRATDGKKHAASVYFDNSAELAVNSRDEAVVWRRQSMGPLTALKIGTSEQAVLGGRGDDIRINYGYAYAAAPSSGAQFAQGAADAVQGSFVRDGKLPGRDDRRMPRAVKDAMPVSALALDFGQIGAAPVSHYAMLAYDEIYEVRFFKKDLRPYWRRDGATPSDLLQTAARDYPALQARCAAFDDSLMADLEKQGGARYAQIAALAYREAIAGTGLAADGNGKPLLFTKENTSNGDIATVDVIFPADPIFLLFSPALAKASLVPVMLYAASPRWKFPNAPHDLGTYPIASGTDDGGEGMPVEESANMLILLDAIAKEDGNADFASQWWPKVSQWAAYLQSYGLDPEDQLCTDDFMGHLAHNSNLSVKAIIGLAAYGDMCRIRGDNATAEKYFVMAQGFAKHWVQAAGDGNHSRLAFDKPNTWSQKYNLVWDQILNLHVFPPAVAPAEIAYYKSVLQPYGVPLDSRTHLTKTDWSVWSATMADNQSDFETLVSPIYDYLNTTPTRLPLVDSYVTDNIKSDGMHARPVVGGLFIKMLADPATWFHWSTRGADVREAWAPFPAPPQVAVVVPTSQAAPINWRYTTTANPPAANWYTPSFNDSAWKQGPAGFGTNPPGVHARTVWSDTPGDIWIRRTFDVPAGKFNDLQFQCYHDEDVEIYVNGVLAAKASGYTSSYDTIPLLPAGRAALHGGANVIAAHCHQTDGGQFLDIGLVNVTAPAR